MKKALAIALMGVLFTISVGILVNLHFCHGNLVEVSLYEQGNTCCCSKMALEYRANCCENKTLSFHQDLEQTPVNPINTFSWKIQGVAPVKSVFPVFSIPSIVPNLKYYQQKEFPPEDKVILHRKLILYG
ncbi:HYC_CC_PP family protein [Luteibaculum oceani]|uniref:Uncharacterized protein n=1 Tax=Luteibaculum oceani TaxID=1294296 RepID=A0A5C6UZJ6_9FLAO|nr:hypothetical protein [Luteibaculum oceani]TXC76065.1 hypothetical protein FRX97_11165 [Luteibaculum oceani]